MEIVIKTECTFDKLLEKKAIGKDSMDNTSEQPASKVAHLRSYHRNWKWWSTYFPCNNHLRTVALVDEFAETARYLFDVLFAGKDGLHSMCEFCKSHPGAAIGPHGESDFFIEGEQANYWLRLICAPVGEYHSYLHAYSKEIQES